MKVLSLIQPYATLIALNEKRIETRSWKTNYRGELYIHASKKIDQIMYREPFWSVLKSTLIESSELLTGMIIAKCNLIDCEKILINRDYAGYAVLENSSREISGNEYHFGDYTPGRWAWILEDIEMLKEPIPAKGKLSIWNYEMEGFKC